MSMTRSRLAALALALCLPGCSGGGGSSSGSSPTAPTPTPAPIPSGAAGSTLTTNGCAATYACPNLDVNGNANPSTPTFNQLTVSNGTTSTCRADIGPGSPPPPAMVPIDFTIRNPSGAYQWTSDISSSARLASPFSGSAASAGPVQATVQFMGGQGSRAGETVTQTLTLQIRRIGSGTEPGTVVASCAVTMWGFMRPER